MLQQNGNLRKGPRLTRTTLEVCQARVPSRPGNEISHKGEPLTPMRVAEPPADILTMSGAAMACHGLILSQVGAMASRIVLNVFPYPMQCGNPNNHQDSRIEFEYNRTCKKHLTMYPCICR